MNGTETYLAHWNSGTQKWAVPTGNFAIHEGNSSAFTDLPLTGTLHVVPG